MTSHGRGTAEAAALAALDDAEHVRHSIETNRAECTRVTKALMALGLEPVPSEATFLFVEMGQQSQRICESLLRSGVIVRSLGWMGFPEAVRVTVGTATENDRFLAAPRACACGVIIGRRSTRAAMLLEGHGGDRCGPHVPRAAVSGHAPAARRVFGAAEADSRRGFGACARAPLV